jgi:hypothetical protein
MPLTVIERSMIRAPENYLRFPIADFPIFRDYLKAPSNRQLEIGNRQYPQSATNAA